MSFGINVFRQKTEALALAPFQDFATSLGLSYTSGQGSGNRLPIQPNVYFQFGDLRVELPHCTVVVEIESAGGVTNLAKYWESIESNRISKPVKLLHVFLQKSKNDYQAHILLWQFLDSQMRAALGSKWESHCVKSEGTSLSNLDSAITVFKHWLTTNAT